MKLRKTDASTRGEGLSAEAVTRMEKELDALRRQVAGLPASLERMHIESAIAALETRIKMATQSSPMTGDAFLDEQIKSLEKQRDNLRSLLTESPGDSDLSSVRAKISQLNIQIEILRAHAVPLTMGPPSGTADAIKRLEKERDDFKARSKNLPQGMERDSVETAINEIEIRIDMLRALSNPAPSRLQGFGVLPL